MLKHVAHQIIHNERLNTIREKAEIFIFYQIMRSGTVNMRLRCAHMQRLSRPRIFQVVAITV
jgi:hypothetical protein